MIINYLKHNKNKIYFKNTIPFTKKNLLLGPLKVKKYENIKTGTNYFSVK